MGDLVLPEREYPLIEQHGIELPHTAIRLHGCGSCEWKGTKMCSFGFRASGQHSQKQSHANGICEDRKRYLASFTRDYLKQPTYSQWKHDFNNALAQTELMREWASFQAALEQELDHRVVQKLRANWIELHRLVAEGDNRSLDRELPKKIEIDDKRLTPNDVIRLMRNVTPRKEKVIDVEYDDKQD